VRLILAELVAAFDEVEDSPNGALDAEEEAGSVGAEGETTEDLVEGGRLVSPLGVVAAALIAAAFVVAVGDVAAEELEARRFVSPAPF